MEVVGTALGHSVDCTAGEAGLAYVERSDVDAHLVESVERDRGTAGRKVGTDTECVVECGAIDSHIGRTVVSATDCKTVGSNGCLRGELEYVVHRTVSCRKGVHCLLADGGTCA